VYQRADGYWVGAVSGIDGTGRRRRVVVYGKTKGDALTKLKEVRPIGPDVVNDVRGLTVAGWLDRWLEMARAGLAPTTALRYGELIRLRLKPLIGGVKLAQVGVFHVQKLLADMEGREISARGRQMAFLVLSRALKAAVKARLLQYNPAADVEGKPRVPKPEVTVYTEEESALLLAAAQGHRLAPLLVVAMDSGAPPGRTVCADMGEYRLPRRRDDYPSHPRRRDASAERAEDRQGSAGPFIGLHDADTLPTQKGHARRGPLPARRPGLL